MCGRFLEILLYSRIIRTCRLCIAEAKRFPRESAQYFDVVFSEVQEALSAYLQKAFGVVPNLATEAAQDLLGRVIPQVLRALFGLDPLSEHLDDEAIRTDCDLSPIHGAVTKLMESLG